MSVAIGSSVEQECEVFPCTRVVIAGRDTPVGFLEVQDCDLFPCTRAGIAGRGTLIGPLDYQECESISRVIEEGCRET